MYVDELISISKTVVSINNVSAGSLSLQILWQTLVPSQMIARTHQKHFVIIHIMINIYNVLAKKW